MRRSSRSRGRRRSRSTPPTSSGNSSSSTASPPEGPHPGSQRPSQCGARRPPRPDALGGIGRGRDDAAHGLAEPDRLERREIAARAATSFMARWASGAPVTQAVGQGPGLVEQIVVGDDRHTSPIAGPCPASTGSPVRSSSMASAQPMRLGQADGPHDGGDAEARPRDSRRWPGRWPGRSRTTSPG